MEGGKESILFSQLRPNDDSHLMPKRRDRHILRESFGGERAPTDTGWGLGQQHQWRIAGTASQPHAY